MLNILRSHNPLLSTFLDSLFPLYCNSCEQPLTKHTQYKSNQSPNPFIKVALLKTYLEQRLFCENCLNTIGSYQNFENRNLCTHCGSSLSISSHCPCEGKLNPHRTEMRFRSVFTYSEDIRKLIFLIKFNPSVDLCNWLGLMLFINLSKLFYSQTGPSYITWDSISFVPSRLNNVLTRGGYSTYWITKSLSRLLGDKPILFINASSAHRQTSLQLKERFTNNNRFNYKPIPKYTDQKSTLLIDDMLTTGSSSYQVAQSILDTGIKRVDILTLARSTDFRKNYLRYLEGVPIR